MSAVFFLLFGAYSILWMHQPEFDWMPVFCAACISFSSGIGLSQLPFLISAEIFAKKVSRVLFLKKVFNHEIFNLFCFNSRFDQYAFRSHFVSCGWFYLLSNPYFPFFSITSDCPDA